MQALNIEAASKLAVVDLVSNFPLSAGGTSTPLSLNTPDILNSLISITSNPFFGQTVEATSQSSATVSATSAQNGPCADEDKKVFTTLEASSESSGRANSGGGSTTTLNLPPPSTVQSLRSQFIKDSLKLTIQTKRKSSGKGLLDLDAEVEAKVKRREELTPEDEERRRRRRERNKIAATKCRNKKKEKTGLLVLESQTLERTNVTLKTEISKLEEQRQHLSDILAAHAPLCLMKSGTSGRVQLSYNRNFDLINSPSSASAHFQHQPTQTRHHLSAQRS